MTVKRYLNGAREVLVAGGSGGGGPLRVWLPVDGKFYRPFQSDDSHAIKLDTSF